MNEEKLTKKQLAAGTPMWCPACGNYSVLAAYFKVLEKLQIPHENIVTLAGIGCSSRFPYFVNTYGAHFIHGRAVPLATGVSLARPDLYVFVFGGDGDAYSIGGNHLQHAARKNINLTYVIMDNFIYGLTKKQTSPTSPVGFKSKTDPGGSLDRPINPIRTLLASGATYIARTHTSQIKHLIEMMERAVEHKGFSVVECLSECVQFNPGSIDVANPRKGGEFCTIEESHDVSDKHAAAKLAEEPWPGLFGVFYQDSQPSKNELEAQLIQKVGKKTGRADSFSQNNFDVAQDTETLRKTFAGLK